MIISASYKTDIPAFYGDWFLRRLAAGSCSVRNVWNGATFEVSLAAADVDGFVFWTRNATPFRRALDVVARRHPFVVQYTVTGYPRSFERSVVPAAAAAADIRRLAATYGPRAVVWRYDPIVVTDETDLAWHRQNFARLAERLAGHVDEVVVSFAHIYAKTRRNLDRAAARRGFRWTDPPADAKRAAAAALGECAAAHGLALRVCAQPELLAGNAAPARCIDAGRLADVAAAFGHPPVEAPTKGNRAGCLCAESRDIGAYDSCPHGCIYCYAVGDPARAKRHFRAHDPAARGLFETTAEG